MANNKKLDIFKLLSRIDTKDINIYDSLDDDERKAFQPYVVTRWLSSTVDERQLILLNEIVNPVVFNLQNHKSLLLKLMTTVTNGKRKRYKYVKYSPKKAKKYVKSVDVVKQYYNYSTIRANEVMHLISNNDILEMAQSMGYQKEELRKIKSEIKNR